MHVVVVTTIVTTFVATFVIPTTARSWIPDVHPAFKNKVHMLRNSSRPIVATWKRLLQPESGRDVIGKGEQHHTCASTVNATASMSGSSESSSSSSSWVDRTMTRVVAVITYFAIGQGIIHLLHANRSEITTELANKMLSPESVEVVQTIQSILANVHTEHGVVDVFGKYRTIDVLASIIALSRLQRIVVPRERSMRIEQNMVHCKAVDLLLAKELAHYAKYAHAAYGWTFDLALRWKVHFGGNNQALVRLTGIHRDDIVKAEWNAKAPHRPAYFIVRDHDHQTIVLCIRGTWSVNDMLTNLYCTSNSKDWFRQLFHRELSCHRGMLEAAKAVYSNAEAVVSHELLSNPEYSLVLTGHSLGGGCAALLGKLFENRYPTLKVYLFGAPCVVPERNSITKNVISVIAKGDPFSSLSLGHVADVSISIECLCNDDVLRDDVLLHTRNPINDDKDDNLSWCIATMNMLRKRMNAEKLYPPGRILLLHNDRPTMWESSTRRLRWWRWRRPRRNKSRVLLQEVHMLYFRDLIISANMFNLSKHLPSMYISTLNDFVRKQETNRI